MCKEKEDAPYFKNRVRHIYRWTAISMVSVIRSWPQTKKKIWEIKEINDS